MFTEHTVTYGNPDRDSQYRTVKREAFEYQGRFLGTETVRHFRFEGEKFGRGWTWVQDSPTTVAFRTREELSRWIDDMFREHDIAQVKASGGTKLVFLS